MKSINVLFHSMQEFPEQEPYEHFSKTVLVYDEDDDIDFGYYDFDKEQWFVFGDFSTKLICWCYPPNPSEFISSEQLKSETHYGYRP